MKFFFQLAILLFIGESIVIADDMKSVDVTGFNRDVVIEANVLAAPFYSYANELNPGDGYVYYQTGLQITNQGLPSDGSFVSAYDGTTVFQFQPYTSNNALVLSVETGINTGTLTLSKPEFYKRIAVIANSVGGNSNLPSFVLTFNNGATLVTNYNALDWFDNPNYALGGVGAIHLGKAVIIGYPDNPRFYQTTIDLSDFPYPLVSLSFTQAPGARMTGVYAVSGEVNTQALPEILVQPTNTTVQELSAVTFYSLVAGQNSSSIQWYKNGTLISGETNSTLTLNGATWSDNQSRFQMVVSNMITNVSYVVTSSIALLTVIQDKVKPVLIRASSQGLSQLRAEFSEPLSLTTATNLANYLLSGRSGKIQIYGVEVDDTQSNVVLNAQLIEGGLYTLTVNNVSDRSAARNLIQPNSTAAFIASSWMASNLGGTAASGIQTPLNADPNGMDLKSIGSGETGAEDLGLFSCRKRTGDFDVRTRVVSLSLGDSWSFAGFMARQSMDVGSPCAEVLATPSISGVFFQYRKYTNGENSVLGSFPVNYPNTWLRLKRAGNLFTGFAGVDGSNWVQLGSATISMSTNIYIGFISSSHDSNVAVNASFRDFGNVTNATTVDSLAVAERSGQCSRFTSIAITEIMYHPVDQPGAINTNSSGMDTNSLEFVELLNTRGEPENLSGYKLGGDIDYTFPQGTILPGGAYLVVARNPADVASVYHISNVMGPFLNNLPNDKGTVKLISRAGAVFLEVNYSTSPPWPVSADGTGHSLVLTHPSYGENNPLAWSASDSIGGSPGRQDTITTDVLRNVLINELLVNGDSPFVELYNRSEFSGDISGCVLTDIADEKRFIFPQGTIIAGNGHLTVYTNELGFSLSNTGGEIFFKNAANTRVLDALRYESQGREISLGRTPDGSAIFRSLAFVTPNAQNSAPRRPPVVINEIYYSPISDDDSGQYIELFNRQTNNLSLAGWKISGGISFTFPADATIGPRGYVVVAKNTTCLLTNYATLNPSMLYGNFSGSLSGKGERIVLSAPETFSGQDGQMTTIYPVVNDVTYNSGGRWGMWSHGGGSSLELVNPDADNAIPSNWADSDETAKAPWTQISATGTVMDGSTTNADELQVLLQDAGECLIDNVEVLTQDGNNLMPNSTFESGSDGWYADGTESTSGIETEEACSGTQCYHIRAVGRGDNQANRVRALLTSPLQVNTPGVTIKANVRWLKGSNRILLRLRGNWMECAGIMTTPPNPGTPGAPNSRYIPDAPPAICDVKHSPVLPISSQKITVSARVSHPDGAVSAFLNYRIDPSTDYVVMVMTNAMGQTNCSAGEDTLSAVIPAHSNGSLVAFYISTTNSTGTTAQTFPNDAPTRECLIRVGETQPAGNFPVYRLWMTLATFNTWHTRNPCDNTPLDVTFVSGADRVIYNAQAMYAGSPYVAPGYCSPACGPCGYSVEFPPDDLFLGDQNLNIDWAGGHGSETTALQEEMGYWIADQLNLPFSHRYVIRLHVNGVKDEDRLTTFEAVIQPGADYLKAWGTDHGKFYKIEQAFEFDDSGALYSWGLPDLGVHTNQDGKQRTTSYRWTWESRSDTDPDDRDDLFALANAANASNDATRVSSTLALADMNEWMRVFAFEHIIVNFDSFGHDVSKNMFACLPDDGKWKLYIYDLDWLMLVTAGFSNVYSASDALLFSTADLTVNRMYLTPAFLRYYWRAIQDAVNGPLDAANCVPVMEAKYKSLVSNRIKWCALSALTPPTEVESWFSLRQARLKTQLAGVDADFAVRPTVTVNNNVAIVTGTAPIDVVDILVDGIKWPVKWTGVNTFSITVPVSKGVNTLTLTGITSSGEMISGANDTVSFISTKTAGSPVGVVVINEIMCSGKTNGAEYVELYNTSTNTTYDLSGWQFKGLSYTFSPGSILAPRAFLVLVADPLTYAKTYGGTSPVFDTYDGVLQTNGETLSLLFAEGSTTTIVDRVRYSTSLPWPTNVLGTGYSLQRIDSAKYGWRACNWAAAVPTPGSTNACALTLSPFPPLWINELEPENLTGITNSAGNRAAWLEIYNSSSNSVSLAGLFLSSQYTNLTNWSFPSNCVVGPQQFKVVFVDGQTNLSTAAEPHANFTLTAKAGSIVLTRVTNGSQQVLDYLDYTNLYANHSYGSFPDGQPFDRQMFYYQTPGTSNNGTSPPLSVTINEWMASNTNTIVDPLTGKYDDWFELYNSSPLDADLSGYYLTDDLSDWAKFEIPDGYIVPANGYLLVWADKKSVTDSTDLHAGFKLSKSGGSIGLFGQDGIAIDFINYGQQSANVSMGRYPDGSSTIDFLTEATPGESNVKVNTKPVFNSLPNKDLYLGQTLVVTIAATDVDVPAQTLSYSLESGAPEGISIDATTGVLIWHPTSTGIFTVPVRVTDSGNPPLSSSGMVTANVLPIPTLHFSLQLPDLKKVTFSWQSVSGQSYRIQFTTDLGSGDWTNLENPISGDGTIQAMTININSNQRFYRLVVQ